MINEINKCTKCNGEGTIRKLASHSFGWVRRTCPKCKGTGKVISEK